jgi:hypothetical protein
VYTSCISKDTLKGLALNASSYHLKTVLKETERELIQDMNVGVGEKARQVDWRSAWMN